jgi:YVTN family beta-propeller protein
MYDKSRRLIAISALALCSISPGCGDAVHSAPPPSSPLSASPGVGQTADFGKAMMQSMSKMDADMSAAPMTGDPDHDFAAMMIPHHQGAIDMAVPYLLHGKDPTLRRLAEEIIVSQKQEIEVLQFRLAAFQKSEAKDLQAAPPATQTSASCDRVYTSDQTSNTVSVIDPGSNKLLGVIRLGDPVPGALSPLYRGQLLVHGMGFSPDHRTIAVVSIGSNSVTFIDTATNKINGVVYIGRSPHEAFFTPDGKELWATVRGEDYVSVIDAVTMKEIRRIQTANGPGMVLFRPDGKYAFVPSSFTPELDVVDRQSYQVIARIPQASPFSPNLAVSPDGAEVWFTLKDSGKTQVMSATPPFPILATLDTGPITNHVALVDNADGKFAYVSVGEENVVKVFRRGEKPELVATIPTGDLPHGLWGSPDGTRMFVGLENQDAVAAIDTHTNRVIATIPVGQQPQALVYVPGAVPHGDGTTNLTPLAHAGDAVHLTLVAPASGASGGHATVSVNAIGPLDLLEAAVSRLKPGRTYTLWLGESRAGAAGEREALVTFKTNIAGAQVVQAIAPLRQVLVQSNGDTIQRGDQRFLLVTESDSNSLVLIQSENQR